jgi:hypothetical protein
MKQLLKQEQEKKQTKFLFFIINQFNFLFFGTNLNINSYNNLNTKILAGLLNSALKDDV